MTDFISLVCSLVFVAALLFGMWMSRRSAGTGSLRVAFRVYVIGIGTKVLGLSSEILDVHEDGWFGPVTSVISIACMAVLVLTISSRIRRLEGQDA